MFVSICGFTENISNFSKWLCVLNCCSGFTVVFVPGAEINGGEDTQLPFIYFCRYYEIKRVMVAKHKCERPRKIVRLDQSRKTVLFRTCELD